MLEGFAISNIYHLTSIFYKKMKLKSILQGKCPRCHKAHIFKTFWRMNECCPHCEMKFEREVGYFAMSIFVGYGLALTVGLPGFLVAFFLGLSFFWLIAVPSILISISSPWIFRYARILWIHSDQWMDPR